MLIGIMSNLIHLPYLILAMLYFCIMYVHIRAVAARLYVHYSSLWATIIRIAIQFACLNYYNIIYKCIHINTSSIYNWMHNRTDAVVRI